MLCKQKSFACCGVVTEVRCWSHLRSGFVNQLIHDSTGICPFLSCFFFFPSHVLLIKASHSYQLYRLIYLLANLHARQYLETAVPCWCCPAKGPSSLSFCSFASHSAMCWPKNTYKHTFLKLDDNSSRVFIMFMESGAKEKIKCLIP